MRFIITATIKMLREIRALRNCVEFSLFFKYLNPSVCHPLFPTKSMSRGNKNLSNTNRASSINAELISMSPWDLLPGRVLG